MRDGNGAYKGCATYDGKGVEDITANDICDTHCWDALDTGRETDYEFGQ